VTWSVDPPAAQGTITVIGRLGFQSCAKLTVDIAIVATANERHFKAKRFFISNLLLKKVNQHKTPTKYSR
jgi:hypothetical protein